MHAKPYIRLRYHLFICILVLSILRSGYPQNTQEDFNLQYKKIENSTITYSCKVEKINQLFSSNDYTLDSIPLSNVYNEFSKLNYRNNDFENAILNGTKALQIQQSFITSIPTTVNNSYHNLALF